MSPLARSLLALAVVALLQSASAVRQKLGDAQCTTVSHGYRSNDQHDLQIVPVKKGDQAASITIPNLCSRDPVGEQVTVCDDVPPTVIVPDLPEHSPATVYRNGNYNLQDAPVMVTLWCSLVPEPPCSSCPITESSMFEVDTVKRVSK